MIDDEFKFFMILGGSETRNCKRIREARSARKGTVRIKVPVTSRYFICNTMGPTCQSHFYA